MRLIVSKDHEQGSILAAQQIRDLISAKPAAKLGLATGSTPALLYKELIRMNKAGEVDFSKVTSVNLDEYRGLAPDHPQSYRYFMNDVLFNHINIDPANTYVATGLGDAQQAAKELDAKVYEGGVPDLQILGIGGNGHIAFNEADSQLSAASHIVTLTESTIKANARFFESEDEVPKSAITMGMKGILAAKQIVLLATGPAKKDAIRGLLVGESVTTQNPSTFLKLHDNVTVYIDQELADLVGVG